MKQIIHNLIDNIKTIPCKANIDLVLDGGAFNGSYMIGSLLYMKEMEKRNVIHIERISGCSIGSLLGLLYIGNLLSIQEQFYKYIRNSLANGNLNSYSKVLQIIKEKMPNSFYKKCNNVLYITFYDITNGKQVVRNRYKNNNHLLQCVYCSSFLPFLMNGRLCYHNKYIDGLYPYVFQKSSNKSVLFIDLIQQNITKMLIIKNEVNNSERIMKGILETHNYFFACSPFSFVSEIYYNTLTNNIKQVIHNIRIYITKCIVCFLTMYQNNRNNISYSDDIEYYIKKIFKMLFQYNLS